MDSEVQKTEDVEIGSNITFNDMMLSESVLAGLNKCNFQKPSPIQLRAIPIGRCGLDLMIKSKSGTGKTLVFCTIILERYKSNINAPQSLIVVPTREIALQVEAYLKSVGSKCQGFNVASVIGGRDIVDDRKRINKCKAIVGTPGRLLHLIKNNMILLKHIGLLVLDEADKLLAGDFRKDVKLIFDVLNKNRQTIASSATYADDLDKLLLKFMQNPIAVSTTREIPMLIGVKQFLYDIEQLPMSNTEEATAPAIQIMLRKVKAVEFILSNITFKQCILFSNSQLRAESFTNYLLKNNWTVDLILGSQVQEVRTSTLQKFRQYESRILVSSDLMARGIDIENVNLVINLDVPSDSSTYLHRIGRCGRFGTRGIAITLISDQADMRKFETLMEHINYNKAKIDNFPSPSPTLDADVWDFTNHSEELSFNNDPVHNGNGVNSCNGETDALSESKPIETSNQEARIDETERKNVELLEIAKLLVSSDSIKQVDIDLDIFSTYANDSKRLADGSILQPTTDTNGNRAPSSDHFDVNNTNDCNDILTNVFDDFEVFKRSAGSQDDKAERVKETLKDELTVVEDIESEFPICLPENVTLENELDDNTCFVEAIRSMHLNNPRKIDVPSSANATEASQPKEERKSENNSTVVEEKKAAHKIGRKTPKPKPQIDYQPNGSSRSNAYWHRLYSQQINQINHYVANAYYRF